VAKEEWLEIAAKKCVRESERKRVGRAMQGQTRRILYRTAAWSVAGVVFYFGVYLPDRVNRAPEVVLDPPPVIQNTDGTLKRRG